MKEIYHSNHNNPFSEMDHGGFFRSVALPYGRTKEEVWEALEGKLTGPPEARVVPLLRSRRWLAAAAVAILMLGIFLVLRYYTASVANGPAAILAHTLPDGSQVTLNAESSLSYHPFWWRFDRSVKLDGEGYFEVEKGKKFTVRSSNGTTVVLGTAFSVYARPDQYRVSCFSGAVKVISPGSEEAVLMPDESASINTDGHIIVTRVQQQFPSNSWMNGMFSFLARPLGYVLDEIERQYDVKIHWEDQDGRQKLYTGYFSRDLPLEEVLELVCKPFGLTFAANPDGSFGIH